MNDDIIVCVLIGFIIDCIVGDPQRLPHPVRWIGALVSLLDRKLRRGKDSAAVQRLKGALLVLCVCTLTVAVTLAVIVAAYKIHRAAGIVVQSIICAQCIASRNLYDASMAVYHALREKDIAKARKAVSMIVGRDTDVLDETGITKAAVETVAESTNDGVIAPLFFLVAGGPVLGMLYKAINTMDSMIAYKNDTYRYFGTAAARCDDAAGFIPARLSALCMIASSFLLRFDYRNAWKIFLRDRYKHASPNSAQTESVCAGALRVRLAGDAVYGGILEHKQTLGDDLRPVEIKDIARANQLMYTATVLCAIILLVVRAGILFLGRML